MSFLSGKRILITGIASKLSIAYGIANSCYKYGAKLAFTFQNSKLENRINNFAKKFNSNIVIECDVSNDNSIKQLFINLKKHWSSFDGFVHSIGFCPSNQLSGDYLENINRKDFNLTHDISSYSFVALAKECKDILNPNASLLTLSYIGARRVVSNYNLMGIAKASLEANVIYMANSMGKKNIRVNGISAGPIKTLAASQIKNFRKMIKFYKNNTPLKKDLTIEDIGNSAAFLLSDLSSAITGEILYVDCGFNIKILNDITI